MENGESLMSFLRRIINLEINAETSTPGVIVNAVWKPLPAQNLFRATQILFRAELLLEDSVTPFAVEAGTAFLFGIDDAYTLDKTDLVVSLNDQFNVSDDWDDIDLASGKICWRCDMTSTTLRDSLAAAPSKNMYAALWMCPPGESYTLLAHWGITVRNVAVDPTTATVQQGISYVTADALTAVLDQYLKKHEDGAAVRYHAGHFYHRNPDDSLWYPESVRTIGGEITRNLGEGESL
jgi:hypothetical protein